MRHGHRISRPRQPIDIHRHAAFVLEKERSETSAWKLQRLQAIRLAMEGRETYQRIADIVLCSAASLCKWIRWFREEGLDGLHQWLEGFWMDPSRAFSLIGHGWLWEHVNAGGKSCSSILYNEAV